MAISERIKLQTHFVNITELLQNDLLAFAQDKIKHLEESYFKSTLKKEDAEIFISMSIEKNAHDLYEGKFHVTLDGNDIHYHNDTPFKEVFDVVSHAFKHVKEQLANK